MIARRRGRLARGLFGLGCTLAGLLAAAVCLSPLLDRSGTTPERGWQRLVALFARDATLRRTSLASAFGILVSACVFFRPGPGVSRSGHLAVIPPRRPRSGGMAGA